jgi:hypothetical protein
VASVLKSIVGPVGLAPQATAVIAHGLNWNGIKVKPDEVKPQYNTFAVTAADVDAITVQNIGTVTGDCLFLCESWHSLERGFGADSTTVLVPQPFVGGLQNVGYLPTTDAMTFHVRFGFPGGGGQTYTVEAFQAKGITVAGPVIDHGGFIEMPFTLTLPAPIAKRVEIPAIHVPDLALFPVDINAPLVLTLTTLDTDVRLGLPIDVGAIPPPGSPDALVGMSYGLIRLP